MTPTDMTYRDNVYYMKCYLTFVLDKRVAGGKLTKVERSYIVNVTLMTLRGEITKEDAKLIFRKENMFGVEKWR